MSEHETIGAILTQLVNEWVKEIDERIQLNVLIQEEGRLDLEIDVAENLSEEEYTEVMTLAQRKQEIIGAYVHGAADGFMLGINIAED